MPYTNTSDRRSRVGQISSHYGGAEPNRAIYRAQKMMIMK